VLLPTIESCRTCHGKSGGARADCAECHTYHDKSRERSFDGSLGLDRSDWCNSNYWRGGFRSDASSQQSAISFQLRNQACRDFVHRPGVARSPISHAEYV